MHNDDMHNDDMHNDDMHYLNYDSKTKNKSMVI